MNDVAIEYENFLKKHRINKEDKETEITHTLMGGAWGKYNITGKDYDKFIKLYKQIQEKKQQYVVERPNKTSYLYFDIDWHFSKENSERKYKQKHILKLVKEINNIIIKYFNIDKKDLIAFIHEKEGPTLQKNEYKDGPHIMYFNVPLEYKYRYFLIEKLKDVIIEKKIFDDVPSVNKLDDIIDTSIVKNNGTLMYNSAKENREPYKITKIYNYKFEEIELSEYTNNDFIDLMLCRRFFDDDSITLKNDKENELEKTLLKILNMKEKEELGLVVKNKLENNKKELKLNSKYEENTFPIQEQEKSSSYNKDLEIIKRLVNLFSAERASNYDLWLNVGFALHNISNHLFSTFIEFSKKCPSKFDFNYCKRIWDNCKENKYTILTFYRWAREDNPAGFKNEIENIINPLLKEAKSGAQDDIANIVYAMYRDKFKCVSSKNDTWFEFQNNKWVEVESAYTLIEKITNEVAQQFLKYHSTMAANLAQEGIQRSSEWDQLKNMGKIYKDLKTHNFVKSVKQFLSYKFYDGKFDQKLNDNCELIGFENGVYDLGTMTFRKGSPDDYVTFSVGYDYKEYHEDDPIFEEVNRYLDEVQLDSIMRHYLLEFMASCIRGVPDQHMHFWTGTGSNGKSTTVDLLKKLLGDYFGILPITVLTRKRNNSSGPTPELADKNGKRVLVLQEPEHTDVVYVGQMKELTGSDTLYARGMYEKTGFEYVPQFKMIMPCNNLPNIPARDNGTWRRVRVVPWESEFIDGIPTKVNQFKKDKTLTSKFSNWRSPLMWLLINKYYKNLIKNNHVINEPEKVMGSTKKYKKDSDIYLEFLDEYVEETNNENDVEQINFVYGIFKKWYTESYSEKSPARKEFVNYIDINMKWKMDKRNIFSIKLNI